MAEVKHQRKATELMDRIQSGKTDDYFEDFSSEEVNNLSKALNQNDLLTAEDIMKRKVRSSYSDFKLAVSSQYDDELVEMAERIIEDWLVDQRKDFERYDKAENSERLQEQLSNLQTTLVSKDFDPVKKVLLHNINESLKKFKVPSIEDEGKKLIKEKKRKYIPLQMRTYLEWRKGKPVLSVRQKGRFISWKKIKKADYSKFKKLVRKERKIVKIIRPIETKPKPRIKKTWSIKETKFLSSRKGKDPEKIYEEFLNKFDKIKTKSMIKSKFKEL